MYKCKCGKEIQRHNKRCRVCFIEYLKKKHSGKGNPAYKNGKTINVKGYVVLHRKGKKLLEHRVIMEKVLGRKLSSEEHIHHINRVRHDNRVENLEVMRKGEHHRHEIKINGHPKPFLGRKHTEETKKKMSGSQKVAWLSR